MATVEASTARLLARALKNRDPWTPLLDLVEDQPPGLVAAARAAYAAAGASSKRRRLLAWLLEHLRDEQADQPVPDLLAGVDGEDAAALLRAATTRRLAVSAAELVRLLAVDAAREAAIDAAGLSTSEPDRQLLAPHLRGYLDTPGLRGRAALALGRMRATSHTGDLVARLPELRGMEHTAFVVALELMGDPAAIAGLRDRLAQVPDEMVWDLHHALVCLSGWEPLTPLGSDRNAWVTAVRRAWAGWDSTEARPRPHVRDVELLDAAQARLVVRDGQAGMVIDYDPPSPGSSWPRWDKSLRVAGRPVYNVGSDCGTCETSLRLLGWPPERAATLAGRLRDRFADLPALTTEVITEAEPLLAGLRTGHYLAVLADLDLEHVTDPAGSWWWRRLERRGDDDGWGGFDHTDVHWPGTDHFQLRAPIPGPHPAYGVVLPTQPLDATSAGTIAAHADAIAGGARPAAALLAWIEERHVRGECPERFLVGMVLDGHHKLLAYAREQVPARALLLCRIEDCWGPPDDRALWINETTRPLRVALQP